MDHNGDISFAKDYHNCTHSPPFIYGLPAMQRNVVVGMPVLHISISLGTKLLKLVRSFAADKEAFTQLLTQHERPQKLFGCGPEPMLHALAKLAASWGVECFLSLETPMACGVGICFSCVVKVKTADGWDYRRCCVDGPIFDAAKLVWE